MDKTNRVASTTSLTELLITIFSISSLAFIFRLPTIRKSESRQTSKDKLKILSDAIEQADNRATRLEERHDRLLAQVCSHYLCNQELQEALGCARRSMVDAYEFASRLRRVQTKLVASFPDPGPPEGLDDMFFRLEPESSTRRRRLLN